MTARHRSTRLPCELASVTVGRHFIRAALREWLLQEVLDDAELAVSELVANAVKHACTELEITVTVDLVVTVTVADGAIAEGPETVTIPAGLSGAGLTLTGLSAGTTTVTVSVNGQASSFDVVVEER